MGIKLIMSLQFVFVSIFLYRLTGAQIAVCKLELLGFFSLALEGVIPCFHGYKVDTKFHHCTSIIFY